MLHTLGINPTKIKNSWWEAGGQHIALGAGANVAKLVIIELCNAKTELQKTTRSLNNERIGLITKINGLEKEKHT
jgi:hypothetical protein